MFQPTLSHFLTIFLIDFSHVKGVTNIVVYSENDTNSVKLLCGQNTKIFNGNIQVMMTLCVECGYTIFYNEITVITSSKLEINLLE
jgi:predicted nucleic-acid-binding Zn-ribbon protein